MRWAAYFILAYVALGLQVGLGDHIRVYGATPNLVLLAVCFIAIHAPRDAALLGCFSMGLMQDLLTLQPLGLFALSYGLVALAITGAGHVLYREHPLTHLSLAFGAALMTMAVLLINDWLRPPGEALTPQEVGSAGGAEVPAAGPVRLDVLTEFARVVYTAVLAPFVLYVLQRFRRAFAFQSARARIRRSD